MNAKRDSRCKLDIDEELKVIKLYQAGFCISETSRIIKYSPRVVYNTLKFYNIKRRSHGDGTRLLHRHIITEPPNSFPYNLKDNFSQLLAVFMLTDGYLKKDTGGIMLITTDDTLRRYFFDLNSRKIRSAPHYKILYAKWQRDFCF